MKQYTTPEQTAKLIELGFEKPKSISSIKVTGNIITTAEDLIGEPSSVMGGKITANYSIGELIEMLPSALSPNNDEDCEFHLMLFDDSLYWHVRYTDGDSFCYPSLAIELIDALYDMVVKLKEEGVI